MLQLSLPERPAGQVTEHEEPAAQLTWQGPLWHTKSQWLLGPQVHVPLAQAPLQLGFWPTHVM